MKQFGMIVAQQIHFKRAVSLAYKIILEVINSLSHNQGLLESARSTISICTDFLKS